MVDQCIIILLAFLSYLCISCLNANLELYIFCDMRKNIFARNFVILSGNNDMKKVENLEVSEL